MNVKRFVADTNIFILLSNDRLAGPLPRENFHVQELLNVREGDRMRDKARNAHLGDFVQFVYGKGLPACDRKPGAVPVYGSGGIVDTHNQALVQGPGVVVGRKGTIGSVYWANRDFYPIDTTYYVVPKTEDTRLRYIYYLLKTLPLARMNTDAAVPGLNRSNALQLKVSIPSLPTQDRIGDILSAYDDLIENNRRRIHLLERAARLLYKEWLVHLRFHGHEHTPITDGVPEGWGKKTLREIAKLNYGTSLKKLIASLELFLFSVQAEL